MAINTHQTFHLDITPGGAAPVIHASQGDIGRDFTAVIYNGGYSLPSGVSVVIRGKKPDKTVFEYTVTYDDDTDEVAFSTTEQMTIISGPVECELVFSQGGDVIASANFVLQVEESPYDPNNLSESDVEGLTDVLAGFQRLNRDSNGVVKIGDGVTASGTAEPITGFYVHDEETDTDGVAKVDYLNLANSLDFDSVAEPIELVVHDGYYFQSDGRLYEETANQEAYTDHVAVSPNEVLEWSINYSEPHVVWLAYCAYGKSGGLQHSRTDIANTTTTDSLRGQFIVPSDTYFVAFTYRTYGDTNPVAVRRYSQPSEKVQAEFEEYSGYYSDNANATISNAGSVTQEKYTSNIPVIAGETVTLVGNFSNLSSHMNYLKWAAYNLFDEEGRPFGTRVWLFECFQTQITASVTIPEGAHYIAFSYRTFGDLTARVEHDFYFAEQLRAEETEFIDVSNFYDNRIDAWFRFSDAYRNYSTAAYSKIYNVEKIKKIKVLTFGDYATTLGVGFFNSLEPTESSYMSSYSIPFRATTQANGWWYYSDVPDNAITMVVTCLSAKDSKVYFDIESTAHAVEEKTNAKPFPLLRNKYYYHALTNHVEDDRTRNIIIPAQSVFDISIAKRLGFDCIEANVQSTSTHGKYLVTHGNDNYFGNDVETIDGGEPPRTKIYNTSFADLRANYRYRSIYSKYRTPVVDLEEFLYQCKELSMFPLLQYRDDTELNIAKSILGEDFILYTYQAEHSRELFDGYIMEFRTDTDASAMLARCRQIGKPYMYCLSNPSSYTDAELEERINLLHKHGFYIGFAGNYFSSSYCDHFMKLGFDFAASGGCVNAFEYGNLVNITCDADYSDLTTTGTVSEGSLVLEEGQTITISANYSGLSKYYIQTNFEGSLQVSRPIFAEYLGNETDTFTATDEQDTIISGTAFFKPCNLTLTAATRTVINSFTCKISKC